MSYVKLSVDDALVIDEEGQQELLQHHSVDLPLVSLFIASRVRKVPSMLKCRSLQGRVEPLSIPESFFQTIFFLFTVS